jgi:hypothetical protein
MPPHSPPPPFKASNSRLAEVRKALDENDQLLDKTKYSAAHNTNVILRYLVETTARIEADLILLHGKLQPVLKHLKDESPEQIWRDHNE